MDGFFSLVVPVNNQVKDIAGLGFHGDKLFASLGGAADVVNQRQVPVRGQGGAATAGLAAAQAADAVKPLVLEANTKVLAFVDMPLDPYYESSKLKDTTDGVYTDVFDGFSYGDYDAEEAAEILLDGVSGVLSANA